MSDPSPSLPRRRRRFLPLLIVLITSVGGTWIWLGRGSLPKRFAAVEEGVLYRSAQPTASQLQRVVERTGLKTLLIVREGGGDRMECEVDYARAHGLNVVHVPIESQTRISDEHIRRFWECIDNPAARPILIHCSAGRHRTGFLCALYRIERMGWSVEKAMEEMLSFGFDTADHAMILDQLRTWQPRSRAAGAAATTAPAAREGR